MSKMLETTKGWLPANALAMLGSVEAVGHTLPAMALGKSVLVPDEELEKFAMAAALMFEEEWREAA